MKKSFDFSGLMTFLTVGLIALLFFKGKSFFTSITGGSIEVAKLSPIGNRSKTDAEISIVADRFDNEMSGSFNTDEQLIILWIQELTPADLTQLFNAFGRRSYGLNVFQNNDLIEHLHRVLNDDEFSQISTNLKNAGLI